MQEAGVDPPPALASSALHAGRAGAGAAAGGVSAVSSHPNSPRHFRVEAESFINEYVYCFLTAGKALDRAEAGVPGYLFDCMVVTVFAAFTVEAYCNHLGALRLPGTWDEWADTEVKVSRLAADLDIAVDWRVRPFQGVRKVLKVRNRLAHGRTETLKVKGLQKLRADQDVRFPKRKWEAECTPRAARRNFDDVEAAITLLHFAAGEGRHPFSYSGGGSYSKSLP
jgi:hypothetical protein